MLIAILLVGEIKHTNSIKGGRWRGKCTHYLYSVLTAEKKYTDK